MGGFPAEAALENGQIEVRIRKEIGMDRSQGVGTIRTYLLTNPHLNLTVLDGSFSWNTSQTVDQKSASRPSI